MKTRSERQLELKEAFLAAKSSAEMLKVLIKMESCFQQNELGLVYLTLCKKLYTDGFPEKVLFFGRRALIILLQSPNLGINFHSCNEHASSVCISFALQLLGNACLDLKMIDDSLTYLDWASKDLSKIELDKNSSCGGQCSLQILLQVEILLCRLKVKTSMLEELVGHLRKIVDIKERLMGEGCFDVGLANKDVYEGYVLVGDAKGALPFCLKALEIYKKHLGSGSVEVARIMIALAGICNDLGKYEKGLELIKFSQSVLKERAQCFPDLVDAEIVEGNLLIEMGRYEEAVTVLKGVVSHTFTNGLGRAVAFLYMARAFLESGKFADARICMKTTLTFFEHNEVDTILFATAYTYISKVCEKMNNFELAISTLRIALRMPKLPQKLLAECVTRLFSLVSVTEKEKDLISNLEDVVERFKKDFGSNHCEVGYFYARLGFAYLKLGQEELGVKFMAKAKIIMDVSLGPHHLDSLRISQMLSVTYRTIKRYRLALKIQKEVIKGLEGMGSSEQEFMNEAVRILERLKEKVAESHMKASCEFKDGTELLFAKLSKCGISDDGNFGE